MQAIQEKDIGILPVNDPWSKTGLIPVVEQVVSMAVRFFGHRDEWEGRAGGAVCYWDVPTRMHIIAPIGQPDPRKTMRYHTLAPEKASRLSEHPEHRSSWQTRNPDADKWGGAVRCNYDRILAFSGLPELADEAVMLVVSVHLELLDIATARFIAQVSSNLYYQPLQERWNIEMNS